MANFFARQQVPLTPNPEPPEFQYLRAMLAQQAMGQMMNPYGLSPQGAANFGGFNQGNRSFNPYGPGYGPGGAQPGAGGTSGPSMPPGGMGSPPPQAMGSGSSMQPSGGLPPNIMQILSQLLGGGMGAGMGGGAMQGQNPPMIAPRPQMGQPQQMQQGMGPMQPMQGIASQPRQIMPVSQPQSGYDGTTVGYGGRMAGIPAGGFSAAGQGHFGHAAPQSVISLMRALGQVPRPHPMGMGMPPQASNPAMGRPPVNPMGMQMGAMRMPRGRF